MAEFQYKYYELFNPCLQAIRQLGGSGTNREVEQEVSEVLGLTEDEINDIHRGNVTKLSYRLAWARSYLKEVGALENSDRGVWALTAKGKDLEEVDGRAVIAEARKTKAQRRNPEAQTHAADEEEDTDSEANWQDELLTVLKEMPPDAFERLSQRLLRELGFMNVEVTGKSADGGIDGKGILNIGSIVTFRVVFQCKRYKDVVSSPVVRDFRGAVQGRADKGLLITTGRFTRDARVEAQRDGALVIDLLDGIELTQKLKDLGMGVKVELVEAIEIDPGYFQDF
jgi:restriction system protein